MNPAVIEFTRTHLYTASAEGISVPVALASANRIADFLAYVFERRHAEMLNLEVEAGEARGFRTAAGRVDAFGNLGDERINRNLLGLVWWLDRIRLGLIDHDGELYVARYD